jgi:hypothetical protein
VGIKVKPPAYKKFLSSKKEVEFGNYVCISALKELSEENLKLFLLELATNIGKAAATGGYKPLPKTTRLLFKDGSKSMSPLHNFDTIGAMIFGKFTAAPESFLIQLAKEVERLHNTYYSLTTWKGFLRFQLAKAKMYEADKDAV